MPDIDSAVDAVPDRRRALREGAPASHPPLASHETFHGVEEELNFPPRFALRSQECPVLLTNCARKIQEGPDQQTTGCTPEHS